MSGQHTPGPWRVTRAADLPVAVMAPDPDLGWVGVAKVVVLNDHEANANLIAAAPELLDALNDIAAWSDDGGNEHLKVHGTYGMFDEPASVEIARKALANFPPPHPPTDRRG